MLARFSCGEIPIQGVLSTEKQFLAVFSAKEEGGSPKIAIQRREAFRKSFFSRKPIFGAFQSCPLGLRPQRGHFDHDNFHNKPTLVPKNPQNPQKKPSIDPKNPFSTQVPKPIIALEKPAFHSSTKRTQLHKPHLRMSPSNPRG